MAKHSGKIAEEDPLAVQQKTHMDLMQAENLRRNGKFKQAASICVQLISNHPQYAAAHHTLGLIYGELGEPHKAVNALNRALMLNPRSWTTLTALGGEYLVVDAPDMAIHTLERAIEINGDSAEIHVTLAQVYSDRRYYDRALNSYQRAVDLKPDMEIAVLGLAYIHAKLGDHDKAAPLVLSFLENRPPTLQALKLALDLPGDLVNRDLAADLKSFEDGQGTEPDTRQLSDILYLKAGLAKSADRYQDAWNLAEQANDRVKSQFKSEIENEVAVIEQRLNWFVNNKNEFRGKIRSSSSQPTSLFILGPSRSGKTTVEGLLATHDDVVRGFENPIIDNAVQQTYHSIGLLAFNSIAQLPLKFHPVVGDTYISLMASNIGPSNVFTSTSPGHIWDAVFFPSVLDNVRFVFVKRSFEDVFTNIYFKRYKQSNFYSYDQAALARYLEYYDAMIDALADVFPDQSLVVNYEDVINNPAAIARKMYDHVGLSNDWREHPATLGNDIGIGKYFQRFFKTRNTI